MIELAFNTSLPTKLSGYFKLKFYLFLDVDECLTDDKLCRPGTCMNSIGGYKCDCPKGYEPSADGRKCLGRFFGQFIHTMVQRMLSFQIIVDPQHLRSYASNQSFLLYFAAGNF